MVFTVEIDFRLNWLGEHDSVARKKEKKIIDYKWLHCRIFALIVLLFLFVIFPINSRMNRSHRCSACATSESIECDDVLLNSCMCLIIKVQRTLAICNMKRSRPLVDSFASLTAYFVCATLWKYFCDIYNHIELSLLFFFLSFRLDYAPHSSFIQRVANYLPNN